MISLGKSELAEILEKAYQDFHQTERRNHDPIQLVYKYKNAGDQELVAFLTAILAYGGVSTILKSAQKVLEPLGPSPLAFLQEKDLSERWKGFCHRFTTGEDIEVVLTRLQNILRRHRSLEEFFMVPDTQNSTKELLSSFVTRLDSELLPPRLQNIARKRARNLKYLISDPKRGSACKRLNLFLRWVVRPQDGIDLGLWTTLSPRQLILPVDTHLLQTLRRLNWTRSEQATWKVAEQATEKLREFCPEDPIRYDFALCHLSMSGQRLSLPPRKRNSNA